MFYDIGVIVAGVAGGLFVWDTFNKLCEELGGLLAKRFK